MSAEPRAVPLARAAPGEDEAARALLEATAAGIVIVSAAGGVLRANAEAARLLGLEPDALARRRGDDLVPLAATPCTDVPPARCLATGTRQGPATLCVRRGVEERAWVDVTAVPFRDAAGGWGAVVTLLDATARVREGDAARRAETRYATLVANLPEIVCTIDGEGRLLSINHRGEGYRDDEVHGRSALDFVPPEHHAAVREALRAAVDEGRASRLEVPAHNGRWYQSRVVPLDRAERLSLFVVTDVTDRRRSEEDRGRLDARILEAHRLDSLGLLAGGLAHDFNGLLVGILGHVDLALGRTQDAEGRTHLEAARTATLHAAGVAHNLLAGSGKAVPLDLNALAAETIALMRPTFGPGVRVETALSPGLPAVRGDPVQVRQVVMNLVTNAGEAVERAGRVLVRTRTLPRAHALAEATSAPEALDAPEYVCLEVEDDGRGMDEATRLRVFDPFFTTKVAGRGLGLAAVLGIVRAHGGAVSVRSEPGRGATFSVMLPSLGEAPPLPSPATTAQGVAPGGVHAGAADAPPPGPVRASSARGAAVLVVDDEPHVRAVARAVLEAGGYEVLLAADGPDAEAILAARAVDVVVLDVLLPNMTGEEAVAVVRRLRPEARVLVSSGYGEEDLRRRFGAADLAGYLAKPYGVEELLAAVGRAAAGRTG